MSRTFMLQYPLSQHDVNSELSSYLIVRTFGCRKLQTAMDNFRAKPAYVYLSRKVARLVTILHCEKLVRQVGKYDDDRLAKLEGTIS